MSLPLDEILSVKGNKYEQTAAIIKYARYLAQKNDDVLEVPVGGGRFEKVTLVALKDVLTGVVGYETDYDQTDNK